MATLIEVIPKYTNDFGQEVFTMSPGASVNGVFQDGYVSTDWFKSAFPTIANATIPLAQEQYEALKAIGDFWKINAINWRKNGVVEVDGAPADQLIEEEETFLAEMYPPAAEQTTEEA